MNGCGTGLQAEAGNQIESPSRRERNWTNRLRTVSRGKLEDPRIIALLARKLRNCWSERTAANWIPETPAKCQDSVTALVVQDLFGGDLARTYVAGRVHLYNIIAGQRVDLTDSQFECPIRYDDEPCSRTDAFAFTTLEQYRVLKEELARQH